MPCALGTRLKGPDKEQSRLKAIERMPSAAPYLKLKKSHGKAEGLLIAIYGAAKLMQERRMQRWAGDAAKRGGIIDMKAVAS